MTSRNNSSARWHVSEDGISRPCEAAPGNCKKGNGMHYASRQAAMEATIVDMLSAQDKLTPRMRVLAHLDQLDHPVTFLNECAVSSDSWVREKVAQYPQPLSAEAVAWLATDRDVETRRALARRSDLSDPVTLLMASDRDVTVREAVVSARGMDSEQDEQDLERIQARKFGDARWIAEARLNHPSPVVRHAAIQSLPVSSGDATTVLGENGQAVLDFERASSGATRQEKDDFLHSYRQLKEDEDARLVYAQELVTVAGIAQKTGMVREFQNARQVAGDIGAVLALQPQIGKSDHPDAGRSVLQHGAKWLPWVNERVLIDGVETVND